MWIRPILVSFLVLLLSSTSLARRSKNKHFDLGYDPIYNWVITNFDIGGKAWSLGALVWMLNDEEQESVTNTMTSLKGTGIGMRASYYHEGRSISDGWVTSIMASYFSEVELRYEEQASGDRYKGDGAGGLYGLSVEHNWIWKVFFARLGLMGLMWDGPVSLDLEQTNGSGVAEAFLTGYTGTNDPQAAITLQLGFVF